jgi:hypothetical protein
MVLQKFKCALCKRLLLDFNSFSNFSKLGQEFISVDSIIDRKFFFKDLILSGTLENYPRNS